jgi:DNA-binding transcriptional regulator WhiA
MPRPERDLVVALRAELAAIDPTRACDREAMRIGLDLGARPRDPTLARLAVRLGRREPAPAPAAFDWVARPEICRMAWLRGRFLARGSLSLANGRTHLEFVVPISEAPVLAGRLEDAGMPATWRIRRGRGVVTWKGAETVDEFLRRIGAGPTLLEIEARQVSRSLRGELNRILNAESANLARTVAAAGRQLEAIGILSADGRLAEESATVRAVAAARRETPEATLTELAGRVGMNRSAVQRALDRLERVAMRQHERADMRDRDGRAAHSLA